MTREEIAKIEILLDEAASPLSSREKLQQGFAMSKRLIEAARKLLAERDEAREERSKWHRKYNEVLAENASLRVGLQCYVKDVKP